MTVPTPARAVAAPAISLPIAMLTLGLLLVLAYLVTFDQGALSRSGMLMHELMHDGRHLLGVPCH
ncbi:CbtB-domain containing protein [Kribbella sp. NBC_01245]|uniref:CbtB domain-containing protein n=1 Tax=Kribbella sp. NBC_01245 TaxID=2903578 RepID=UPI002E27AD7B|nr:CbtB-domain containing protein [Kribbella sp. NBC_01245]